MPALVLGSGLAIALATVAGALLARLQPPAATSACGLPRERCSSSPGCTLLPDAWSAALSAGLPVIVVPAAALAALFITAMAVLGVG
jgi:hypothetical protein